MKSLYLLFVTLFLSVVACRTKDGAPGPAGEHELTQQGSITANITFKDESGSNVVKTVKYEYFASLSENIFYYGENGSDGNYQISFGREDLTDNSNYIGFNLMGNSENGVEDEPFNTNANFYFITVVNNRLVEFYDSDIDITNVNLDPSTGRLTFDYSGTVYYNGGSTGTVTGKADVILNRLHKSIFNIG